MKDKIDFTKYEAVERTVFSWDKYFEADNPHEMLLSLFGSSLIMVVSGFPLQNIPDFVRGFIFLFFLALTICLGGWIGTEGTITKYDLVKKE